MDTILSVIDFLNKNMGIVTIIVGGLAYFVYWKQRQDNKRDAAKIILQEIRRAEEIMNEYKEHGQYTFTKKIIATNSWSKNIHYFVGDFDIDELDKISTLYSTGEYLDSLIAKISDVQFQMRIEDFESQVRAIISSFQKQSQPTQPEQTTTGQVQAGHLIKVPLTLPSPWKSILDEITYKYDPIYHSAIGAKLKKIAGLK
jgi:hypothetical protein